jgi:glycosyltransferase involved in cell wall biosynthesis
MTEVDPATTTAGQTPEEWRRAALAILFGGGALGYLGARSRTLGRLITAAFGAALASALPIALASRRSPIEADRAETAANDAHGVAGAKAITFSVLVAARDEAASLPNLVADIAAQDHRGESGRPLFELIVIDDRSIDGSPQAVLRAAAASGIGGVTRLVRRTGNHLADGKGAALTAVQPEACHGDVVVVLDADARIGPSFLSTVARYASHGVEAMTARRRVLDAQHSALAGAHDDEQLADGEIQRGRFAMGGCSEFRGNGIIVRRDLLARVGGWRAEALTEDLDLSSRIAAQQGVRVAWLLDAEVWEEPVRDVGALWRQRVRWAEGALRRLFEHGPAVMNSKHLTAAARADFAAYALQLAAPPVVAGAVAAGIVHRRPRFARRLIVLYAAVAFAIGFDAMRWVGDRYGRPLQMRERLVRSLRLAAFGSIWLAAVPAALWRLATRRGAVGYDKMPHTGAGEWVAGAASHNGRAQRADRVADSVR